MQASDNLKDMCNDLNLTQLVTKPTWPNPKDPSVLHYLNPNFNKYTREIVFLLVSSPKTLVTIPQLFVLEM